MALSTNVFQAPARMAQEAPLTVLNAFLPRSLAYSPQSECSQTCHSNCPLPGTHFYCSEFSIAVMTHDDQGNSLKKKALNLAYGFRGAEFMMAEQWDTRELTS